MQSDVDNFFWLAAKLGIKSSVGIQSELIEMNGLRKLISDIDDTRTKIEIFFTKAGVTKLQEADGNTGFLAFQTANGHNLMSATHQALANNMLQKYESIKASWWAWFGFRSSLNELIVEYEQQLGRDFKRDYHNFVRAKHFGALLSQFCNAKNTKHARNFFALLGRSPDFEYKEILVALVAIAGRENILVHRLCMSGGNIILESIDEGEIQHPRDRAKKLFNRSNLLQNTA